MSAVRPENLKVRPATFTHGLSLRAAGDLLKSALCAVRAAGCPSLEKKIKSALKSHEGATRHMRRRLNRGGAS